MTNFDPGLEISKPQWTIENRLSLALIILLYPPWWFLAQIWNFSGTTDSLAQRMSVAGYAAIILALSFKVNWIKKNLTPITTSALMVLVLHSFYFMYLNHMHFAYSVGVFMAVISCMSLLNDELSLCLSVICALLGSWLSTSRAPIEYRQFFILGIATVVFVTYISTKRRLKHIESEFSAKRTISAQQSKILNVSKLSALGEMAGGVAHEINTPLTTIRIAASNIQKHVESKMIEPSNILKQVFLIEKTINRISKIIIGLKTFSRDASHDPLVSTTVNEVVQESLLFCREQIKAKGIKLLVEEFSPSLSFAGRHSEISQVLLNLINNSADAVVNLPERWIKISALDKKKRIQILVTDSGPGIAREIQQKIFAPFFTTKEVGQGTGLGLSIALGIIETHGGELRLEKNSPHTCFLISLPKQG